MHYPNYFLEKVRATLMDACLPGAVEAMQALESGHGAPVGTLLEGLSNFHYSPEQIVTFFVKGEETKIQEAAQLAIACRGLLSEWDRLYRAQHIKAFPQKSK